MCTSTCFQKKYLAHFPCVNLRNDFVLMSVLRETFTEHMKHARNFVCVWGLTWFEEVWPSAIAHQRFPPAFCGQHAWQVLVLFWMQNSNIGLRVKDRSLDNHRVLTVSIFRRWGESNEVHHSDGLNGISYWKQFLYLTPYWLASAWNRSAAVGSHLSGHARDTKRRKKNIRNLGVNRKSENIKTAVKMKLDEKINAESRTFYTEVTHFDSKCQTPVGFFFIYIRGFFDLKI